MRGADVARACVMAALLLCGCEEHQPWDPTLIEEVANHPAWTPDGSRVVYDAQGGLWSVDFDGNHLCMTANWSRSASLPDVSPDGAWLVFDSNARVCRARLRYDGTIDTSTIEVLTDRGNSHFPRWSPDGASIAFDSDVCGDTTGRYGVCIMNSDGSRWRRLPDVAAGAARAPSWSPDGASLVYFAYLGGGLTSLVLADTGGVRMRVLHPESTDELDPDWSPDGNRIAFVRSGEADADADVTSPYRIYGTDTCLAQVDEIAVGSTPRWSPDGRRLAFTALVRVDATFYYSTIFVLDIATKSIDQLVWR